MTNEQSPLHQLHTRCGVPLAPFMGCLLPLHYGDAAAEHMAVRTSAGLFDANHRCEVVISGADAIKNLQNLLCSNVSTLQPGQICRSLMLNMQGGVMDDIQLYRLGDTEYRLAMHTLNRDKDLRHIARQSFGDMTVADPQPECRLSLDGPAAAAILLSVSQTVLPERWNFVFAQVAGLPCRISRMGFAGEDGFSLCCAAADGETLYEALCEAGKAFGLMRCGAESFCTLRLEAGHSLYGFEMDDAISPMETGFRGLVQLEKRAFVGREALVAAGEPRRARIGLRLKEGVATPGMPVTHRDKDVGHVTSAAYCPYLNASLALAVVETPYRDVGRMLGVEADDRLWEAEVVALPFFTRD